MPVDRSQPLPLSFAQQRLWFLDQLEPGNPFYNLPTAARLQRPLGRRSLAAEPERNGRAARVVAHDLPGQCRPTPPRDSAARASALADVDLRRLARRRAKANSDAQLAAEAALPFDLARGPLVRATLFRLADDEQCCCCACTISLPTAGRWACSSARCRPFTTALRQGASSPLAAPAVQYADFAVWQRSWLDDARLEPHLAWWEQQLAGDAESWNCRPIAPPHAADVCRVDRISVLPAEISGQLQSHQPGGRRDSVHVPAGRRSSRAESLHRARTIWSSGRRLPAAIASNWNNWSVSSPTRWCYGPIWPAIQLSANCWAASSRPRSRPIRIRSAVRQAGRACRARPQPAAIAAVPGGAGVAKRRRLVDPAGALRIEPPIGRQRHGQVRPDITVGRSRAASSLVAEYSTELFERSHDRATAGRVRDAAGRRGGTSQLATFGVATGDDADRHQLLINWNDTRRPFPQNRTLSELLAEQAARTPASIAVRDAAGC